MQLAVLASFVLVLTLAQSGAGDAVRRPCPVYVTLLALGAYWTVAAGLARLNTRLSLGGGKSDAGVPPRGSRRHNVLALAGQFWLAAGVGALAMAGYGHWVLVDLHLDLPVPLAGSLLLEAPFLVGLMLVWRLDYPFHQAMRRGVNASVPAPACWSQREYLQYNLRHQFLFIAAPVCLITLSRDVLEDLARWGYLPQCALTAAMACSAGAVFLLAPAIIVRIWRTSPLPAGPLRSSLEEIARRMKVRFRSMLVWQSGGVIANAGVLGLVRPWRYLLLTDGLLENMDPLHVRAVFGHEAAHVACHHIFYSLVFGLATGALSTAAGEALGALTGWSDLYIELAMLVLLGAMWAVGFGWLSRRFERQSDVLGAWAVSQEGESISWHGHLGHASQGHLAPGELPAMLATASDSRPYGHATESAKVTSSYQEGDSNDDRISPEGAATFAWALQQIAALNGAPQNQFNWRHGSIAQRVDYILWLGAAVQSRRPMDRFIRRVKWGLWILLAVSLALAAAAEIWLP